MIEHSPTISEICKGLHGAQGVLTGVFKGKTNPAFKSKYATLETVLDTIRPGLQANGLVVTQAPGRIIDGCLEVSTMLIHTSGEWWRATTHVPLVKRDPQGMGSATTYGLRYSLMAALGVPPSDDDDGEKAMPDRGPPPRPAPAPPLDTRSSSQRMADEMVEVLSSRRGTQAVSRVTGSDRFKHEYPLLDSEDMTRVDAAIKRQETL